MLFQLFNKISFFYYIDLNNFRDFLNDKVQRLTTVLYNHQHYEHQKPIINPDEFVQLIEMRDPELVGFFDLLFQSTNPKGKNAQTQEQLKKKVMLLCHCIASLRNKQVSAAKSAIGLSLTSAGTSVTGINMLAGMGLSVTYQTVYNNLQKIEAGHEGSVRKYFSHNVRIKQLMLILYLYYYYY